MFLITGGGGVGRGGPARPSQVEATGAGICANELSIAGSRCCVQENKRREAERVGCCVQLHFKKKGEVNRGKKRRVPN